MLRLLKNRQVWLGALVVIVLVVIALWPRSVEVDMATVRQGPLTVTIDEEGHTRVRERFEVTSPVVGEVLRIRLEPGDQVEGGKTIVATIRPSQPTLLDARSGAEASAAVSVAEAALERAASERERAATMFARTQQRLDRARELIEGGAIPRDELDQRETDARSAEEDLNAATAAVTQAQRDVDVARARLVQEDSGGNGREVRVVAPVDGVVLTRIRVSQAVVPAGELLLEIGDPRRLEIVADFLSSDAVRISPGDAVRIEQWGGGDALNGRVRRVEPAGFMKVSALGVEEQRVNVIVDLEDAEDASRALGDGYRVEVRVVVWQEDDVLAVPTGSLFRHGNRWAVFLVENGRAHTRIVEIGQRNETHAQVRNGLREQDRIVLYPPDTLEDGDRVTERPGEAEMETDDDSQGAKG